MPTSTFDKTIWIGPEAAEMMANELEKPREPYVNPIDTEEVNRSAKEWLEQRRLRQLSAQNTDWSL